MCYQGDRQTKILLISCSHNRTQLIGYTDHKQPKVSDINGAFYDLHVMGRAIIQRHKICCRWRRL